VKRENNTDTVGVYRNRLARWEFELTRLGDELARLKTASDDLRKRALAEW
jgi:hypothetical protein